MGDPTAFVSEELRQAERICADATHEQAETLLRLRRMRGEPDAVFDGHRRPDGSRAVVIAGSVMAIANLDREGFGVEWRDGRPVRFGTPFDP